MKRIALGLFALLLALAPVRAQVNTVWPAPQGSQTLNVTNSATATTGAFNTTIPAVAGKFSYLCGFVITSGGTTAAVTANVTISGVPTTMNFTYVFVSSGQGLLGVAIPNCIASSAVNTAITISVGAGGAGTTASISAWGYQN